MTVMAQKFAVVELQSVIADMPETAEARTSIDNLTKQYQNQFESMRAELDKLYAEYQQMEQDPQVAQSIKELKIKEITERQQRIEQFQNTAMNEMQRQNETLMAPIQQKLIDAVRSIGAEDGYTFVFPADPGLILYQGNDVTDITSKVRARLGLKPASAAPAAAPAAK